MKNNVSLLTTSARAAIDQTVLDYGAGVYQHVFGDWVQHTQARLYPQPYTSPTTVGAISALNITVYKNWKINASPKYLIMGPQIGTLTSPDIQFLANYSNHWHPVKGDAACAVDITGSIVVPANGTYTFKLKSDDGSYLWIDGSPGTDPPTLDHGGLHGPSTFTVNVTLTQGVHSLWVQFFEDGNDVSGVDLTLPLGVYYGDISVSDRNISDSTLRMLVDYNNGGVATPLVIQVPARFNSAVASPSAIPLIVTNPLSQTVKAGSVVTFSVIAISQLAMTYQWFFNDTAIAGATGSSFTILAAQTVNAGDYVVVVSNSNGASAPSPVATLTID